jgi:predicted ArsR family transcriptional regulator
MSNPADSSNDASTRERLLAVLRRQDATVDELAAILGITPSAVRQQLAALDRTGTVRRTSQRAGTTKPARRYGLTPETELRLSRAYVPLLTQTLHVLARRLPATEFDGLMREVGRGLLADRPRPHGAPRERARAASALLNELGGDSDVVESPDGLHIRAYGCPLAATTAHHPEACNAVESLLAEFTGLGVTQCCDREKRLRCCFEITPAAAPAPRAPSTTSTPPGSRSA